MQTRSQRNTVLGKRDAPSESSSSSSCDVLEDGQLLTPESTPNPKRIRTSITLCDGDWNKENIAPLRFEVLNASPSSRVTRSLRRTSTFSDPLATPRAGRSLLRHRSMSSLPKTPASALAHLSIATPPSTPPSALLPISARARALLRATCNNTGGLAGRADEITDVQCFIRPFLSSSNGGEAEHTVLYISGSPGTGKTALVNAVLSEMQPELAAVSAEFISVNCMALNNVDALWGRLLESLSSSATPRCSGRRIKESLYQALDRLLAGRTSRCVLLLDELDHIASSTQSLVALFNLVHQHSSNMRLIGVANTHTLTSSSTSTLSTESLRHVKTCHFAPYTPQQLLDILQKRLSPLCDDNSFERPETKDKFLPLPTLTLLTKKIATQTGDVRSLFEVLRGAIDIAVNSESSTNPLAAPIPPVTPSHILAALKAYVPAGVSARPGYAAPSPIGNSEIVIKIHNLGLQARLVLLTLLLACKRASLGLSVFGSPSTPRTPSKTVLKRTSSSVQTKADHTSTAGVDVNQLHVYYTTVLTRSESEIFTPVSRSEFGDLIGVLETVGLISQLSYSRAVSTHSKSARRGLSRTSSYSVGSNRSRQDVQFAEGIRLDEVSRALGIDAQATNADVRAEEVRTMFEKERVRMAREAREYTGVVQTFEGASHD